MYGNGQVPCPGLRIDFFKNGWWFFGGLHIFCVKESKFCSSEFKVLLKSSAQPFSLIFPWKAVGLRIGAQGAGGAGCQLGSTPWGRGDETADAVL